MVDRNEMLAEIEAMRAIAEALGSLPPDSVARVLRWAQGFSSKISSPDSRSSDDAAGAVAGPQARPQFTDLAELFGAASPKHGPDKALVAAYWIQHVQGRSDFDAQTVNTELKHLGHGVANITVTLGALMNLRPQLVIQLRKEGNTMQARKVYRLTREGMNRVERMLERDSE